jgi:hypothetical protein
MKILLCKHYPKVKKLEKALSQSLPKAHIQVKSCLGSLCEKCHSMPVAKVNGKALKTTKIKQMVRKITQA